MLMFLFYSSNYSFQLHFWFCANNFLLSIPSRLDKDKHIRLEESFLNEFGAVSQCYKFSTIISNKSVENSENKSEADAKSAQYSVAGLDDATVMKNRDIINK